MDLSRTVIKCSEVLDFDRFLQWKGVPNSNSVPKHQQEILLSEYHARRDEYYRRRAERINSTRVARDPSLGPRRKNADLEKRLARAEAEASILLTRLERLSEAIELLRNDIRGRA